MVFKLRCASESDSVLYLQRLAGGKSGVRPKNACRASSRVMLMLPVYDLTLIKTVLDSCLSNYVNHLVFFLCVHIKS